MLPNTILYTCLALLMACASPAFAQPAYTTAKTTNAKAQSALSEGSTYMNQQDPARALRAYDRAIAADPRCVDAHLYWAGAHLAAKHWSDAELGFEKAIALSADYAPVALYLCAEAEWEQDKFAEAADHAEVFVRMAPDNANAQTRYGAKRLAENARFSARAVEKPVNYNPQPVPGAVNTIDDDYLPTLTADGVTMIVTRCDGSRSSSFCDENFYAFKRQETGEWGKPEALEGVNTRLNEGAQAISVDGSWLVFTGCNRQNDGSQGSCDLYWSIIKDKAWTKPVPFSKTINSPNWDAQPSLSADSRTIFFSSDRPGGRGGKDLWCTTRQADGKWSAPQNLGPEINTPDSEQTPFLHPDGQTLYFTSNGLPGMGGNDLYLVRRKPDGTWGKPQNLGYPINTKASEGTLTVSLDGKTAYFAATQPGGKGGNDIYAFELPAENRPKPVTYARATVTDAATGYPIVAKVEFTDVQTGQVFVTANTKADGTFLVCLPAGKEYALNVTKPKYLFYSANFNLAETATFERPFELNIELQPILASVPVATTGAPPPAPKPVVLRNVFFETGSAALKSASTVELNRLAALLQENAGLRIQINGHTDDTGEERSNLTLSENRAKAVQDHLIQQGIVADRLRAKGFGESQPIDKNDTPEGRASNRRTEFITF